jgi:transposase
MLIGCAGPSRRPAPPPNTPSKTNRRWRACFSPVLDRGRNRIERFFNKIKHYRRIATRYEKLAASFLRHDQAGRRPPLYPP